jgi:hypothetical protein
VAVVVLLSVALIAVGQSAVVASPGPDPDPPTGPTQERGAGGGGPHQVDTSATRAKGGVGRAPGRGRGQLKEFVRERRTVKPFETGPSTFGDFDERTRKREAAKSRARADVFTDAAGRIQHKVWSGRANYRNDRGEWTPIDTNLQAVGGSLRQKANDLVLQP